MENKTTVSSKSAIPDFAARAVVRRECVRNPYSHFNIQQIVGGFVVRAIEVGCDSRTQKRLTIRAEEDIAVQAFAKREIDARHVIGHYHWATRIVRDVLQVLHQRIGDDPVLKWRSQLGANMVDFKVLALNQSPRFCYAANQSCGSSRDVASAASE